ncbi:CRAL-TRIO domain-containing protein [Multifurca ochricompacta]|uniref:CRAL-TRIO domain-containing protein n=1 Tax=Multifurca ochricompacta TaxID=376703 RepID=A0AAD4M6Q7_9AGAM|nr:CRAL-TRIO domain-containing protein [Multifurca ochricompacta]
MDAMDASTLSIEQQPLEALRAELENERTFLESSMPKDDHTLMRFLKARGYSATQAKLMILDCINWRRTVEDVGIDELYRRIDPYDFPGREEISESWPMGFHKHGRPVNIQSFGAVSAKRLYQLITPQEHWQTILVNVESLSTEVLPAASVAAGRPIRQTLVIVDLKGFGLSQFWALKSITRRSFEISQSYYPETMSQMIIINAPTCFTAIWTMITIAGANYHSVLLDLISPENLPVALGGTCTCPDVRGGCAMSNAGPWMDGRAERRARWLRGEIAAPGVPLLPLSLQKHQQQQQEQQQEPQKEEKKKQKLELELELDKKLVQERGYEQTGHRNGTEGSEWQVKVEVQEEGEGEESCQAAASASAATTPSHSWSRASVVGLPLPLSHTPAPAAVRLVV